MALSSIQNKLLKQIDTTYVFDAPMPIHYPKIKLYDAKFDRLDRFEKEARLRLNNTLDRMHERKLVFASEASELHYRLKWLDGDSFYVLFIKIGNFIQWACIFVNLCATCYVLYKIHNITLLVTGALGIRGQILAESSLSDPPKETLSPCSFKYYISTLIVLMAIILIILAFLCLIKLCRMFCKKQVQIPIGCEDDCQLGVVLYGSKGVYNLTICRIRNQGLGWVTTWLPRPIIHVTGFCKPRLDLRLLYSPTTTTKMGPLIYPV